MHVDTLWHGISMSFTFVGLTLLTLALVLIAQLLIEAATAWFARRRQARIAVIEARKDSFPPTFGAESPFMPFSSTKPLILPPCASDLAQTTNTSAIGALEIHILAPFST